MNKDIAPGLRLYEVVTISIVTVSDPFLVARNVLYLDGPVAFWRTIVLS
jgi:hypothetical protein